MGHALDEPFYVLLARGGLGASVVLAARLLLDPTSHKSVEGPSTKQRKGKKKKEAVSKEKLVESRWLLHRREDELVDAALAVDELGLHKKARELEKALWPELMALYGTTALRREALTLARTQQDMVAAHRVLYAITLEEDGNGGEETKED